MKIINFAAMLHRTGLISCRQVRKKGRNPGNVARLYLGLAAERLWSHKSETRVLDPRPKLLGFHIQVCPLTAICQIKRHNE
jgi:hypothetical protein